MKYLPGGMSHNKNKLLLISFSFLFNRKEKEIIALKILCKHILLIPFFAFLCCVVAAQPTGYPVKINNVMTLPPGNPLIRNYITTGKVRYTISNDSLSQYSNFALFGTIKSMSNPGFILTLQPNASIPFLQLAPGVTRNLSSKEILDAFGDFNVGNLDTSNAPGITNPSNPGVVTLPNGTYTICIYARADIGCAASCALSDPNLGCSTPITIASCSQPVNGMLINTMVRQPIVPLIAQAISNNNIISNLQFNSPPGCNIQVKLFGKIERLSPSPFTIALDPAYTSQIPLSIGTGSTQLSIGQINGAFGNFQDNNLVTSGIDLTSIKDLNGNIKLPDGNYRICFYARYPTINGVPGGNASDPNLGCGSFSICNQAGGAPQFTQPVNNLNINSGIPLVRPASPIVFTWLAPQSTCGLPRGGFKYDLEIWELLDNQNVTDAVNNPFVFRKMGLPSNTFLLDTNLNRNVLQEGKRYAIRVRAVSANTNSPVDIDNDGYSRIEAFQYGSNLVTTRNSISIDPQDYYIPYIERNTNYWDDVYNGVKNHSRSDTLMPIREYIAFALTQNATAYSSDAIELFLALNPELADVTNVKISYEPQLPVLPAVAESDRMNFNKQHQINLAPNDVEKNKFLNYLDTLNNYKGLDKTVKLINDLVNHLNITKAQIDSIDRVTVNYVNMTLAELLYDLRLYAKGISNSQYTQVEGLVSTIMDLTTESFGNTSSYHPFLSQKKSSLSSYENLNKIKSKNAVQLNFNINDSAQSVLAAIVKQLLPFDVVLWRSSKEAPYKPVLDAPDLIESHRIFYTLSKLYNHKNPEVNAKSSNRLASTIQLSLPSNNIFTFWTLNMINHKTTTAKDVDLKNVLEEMKKVSLNTKKPSIVIKIE